MEAIVAVLLLETNAEIMKVWTEEASEIPLYRGNLLVYNHNKCHNVPTIIVASVALVREQHHSLLILVVALVATMVAERTFSFGSESRRLETQPSNSGFNNNNSSRGSFGNSAPRPSMQPNQTIERPTQNSGSFGGHR